MQITAPKNKDSNLVKLAMAQKMMAGAGKGITDLSKRRDFIGGLAAPFAKLYGGAQKALGYAQQMPAALKDPKATRSVLGKDKLFNRGTKNIAKGKKIRQDSAFEGIFDSSNPASYRIGRGLGAATIGAPIVAAPFTVPEYLGASMADPKIVEEYAKNRAYQRIEDRLGQFAAMPFMDRIQTAWNPQKFTEQMQSPEATDLYEAMSRNDINNPGIMKYLASFNPFLSSPESVISEEIRSKILNSLNNQKAASFFEKEAGVMKQLFSKVLKPAYRHGTKIRGWTPGTKLPKGVKPFDPLKGKNYFEGLAGQYAMSLGKHPIITPLATAGTAYMPFSMVDSYHQGKEDVYRAAARNAEGLADLGFMEQFNQPGFMGGLGRFGMSVAPGIGSDMILNRIRQSMFPEVSQPGY